MPEAKMIRGLQGFAGADWLKRLKKGWFSFADFFKYIFPLSFEVGKFRRAEHVREWAELIQKYKKVAILAPRGHLKSTTMYAFLMWRLMRSIGEDERWLYISFKHEMSAYHLRNVKHLIKKNKMFRKVEDLTEAESVLRYSWDGEHIFEVVPASVTGFKRGWHGEGVICDDILADPSSQLNPKVIEKINRLFFEEIMYLPNPDGRLIVVGTPQHQHDLFYELRHRSDFEWRKYTAIVDEKLKKVLWPERYSFDELIKMRELRPKEFAKEMMCEPVWSVDSYLERDKVLACVDPKLKLRDLGHLWVKEWGSDVVVGGMDIGKKAHPSYFVVLREYEEGKLEVVYEKWMDRWEYRKQLSLVEKAIMSFGIDKIYYDATRGEFEGFKEEDKLPPQMEGVNLTFKEKRKIAELLEEMINSRRIRLYNNNRTIEELLKVSGDLEAYESSTGHGDSFWGLGLAVKAYNELKKGGYYVATG